MEIFKLKSRENNLMNAHDPWSKLIVTQLLEYLVHGMTLKAVLCVNFSDEGPKHRV